MESCRRLRTVATENLQWKLGQNDEWKTIAWVNTLSKCQNLLKRGIEKVWWVNNPPPRYFPPWLFPRSLKQVFPANQKPPVLLSQTVFFKPDALWSHTLARPVANPLTPSVFLVFFDWITQGTWCFFQKRDVKFKGHRGVLITTAALNKISKEHEKRKRVCF